MHLVPSWGYTTWVHFVGMGLYTLQSICCALKYNLTVSWDWEPEWNNEELKFWLL